MRTALWPLLWIASRLYGAAVFVWDHYWRWAPKKKIACRVISVGNITAGGNGKTPLAIYIASVAAKAGIKTAVVARGYKRGGKGLLLVKPDSPWHLVGDEPIEVARLVPSASVYVCRSKTKAAERAKADGARLIVIDDGFQHRRLARQIDIVCLSADNPLGNGYLLPLGRLREKPKALARADGIVWVGSGQQMPTSSLVPEKLQKKVFHARTRLKEVVSLASQVTLPPASIANKKVVAFCGLANPSRFEATLSASEVDVVGMVRFGDHHRYTKRDIRRLLKIAEATKADCFVTTFKDAVKLAGLDFCGMEVYYLIIELVIDEESAFRKMLKI